MTEYLGVRVGFPDGLDPGTASQRSSGNSCSTSWTLSCHLLPIAPRALSRPLAWVHMLVRGCVLGKRGVYQEGSDCSGHSEAKSPR